MKLRRREFVAALVAGGIQLPLVTVASAKPARFQSARLHVRDSRAGLVDECELRLAGRDEVIDVAGMSACDWLRLARSGMPLTDSVTGVTGWQDFVVLRDVFREAGLWQARPERRIDLPTGFSLFDWRLSR